MVPAFTIILWPPNVISHDVMVIAKGGFVEPLGPRGTPPAISTTAFTAGGRAPVSMQILLKAANIGGSSFCALALNAIRSTLAANPNMRTNSP